MMQPCILLLLASNDVGSLDSRTADEIRAIDEVIQSAAHRDSFKRLPHPGLRASDITKLLLRHNPHILHISGHSRKTEGLVLEDDNSEVAKIKCDQLVRLTLSSTADARLRLVFFSFCYSEGCATEIVAKVPYAMGVNYQKNMWEELGVTVIVGTHQTTLDQTPDQRLRFFSPGKGEVELEQSLLRSSMARINAYYAHTKDELPERCDLTFLVATGAALERLSFQYCNLSYSNLSESNLSGADMLGADLSGAWLFKSNLTRANLNMTDLPYASFRQANLEGASLKSANIESADFRGAKGLSPEQVSVTRNWQSAKFDSEFLAKLRELKNSDEQMSLEPSDSEIGA